MKRYIIILFAVGFFMTLGCKKLPIGNAFLSKQPGVDITKDTIFSTLDYAERFLWTAYYYTPYGLNMGSATNLTFKMENEKIMDLTDLSNSEMGWGGVSTLYYTGQYTASSEPGEDCMYGLNREQPYTGIRKAYIFIDNIDKVPGIDTDLSKRLKAEARMLIAIWYFEIFHYYGGVPWVSHAFDIAENMGHLPRITAQATCDSIVALCDKAAADLPWKAGDAEDGRMTKAGAMALKARVLLFNASPLFNSSAPYLDGAAAQQNLVWHGAYNANLWKQAADAAHALIVAVEAGVDYKLVSSGVATPTAYRTDFRNGYLARGNGEVLISTRKTYTTAGTDEYYFFTSDFSWGAGCPTQELVDMYPMTNGKAITDVTSGYDPAYPFFNASGVPVRDPRLYESVTVNGDAWQGRAGGAQLYIGGIERPSQGGLQAHTGYIVHKFMLDHSTTALATVQQWPYIRLPEIYLSFAEADNEFNGGPSVEGYRCVNLIRSRVGLPNLPAGLTQVQFRDAILLERALEFHVEEIRWFDMVRWKREDIFRKPLHGMNLFRNAGPPVTFTYTPFLLPKRYWQNNWSPKWYLEAFAVSEVQKGYGLVQNPGW